MNKKGENICIYYNNKKMEQYLCEFRTYMDDEDIETFMVCLDKENFKYCNQDETSECCEANKKINIFGEYHDGNSFLIFNYSLTSYAKTMMSMAGKKFINNNTHKHHFLMILDMIIKNQSPLVDNLLKLKSDNSLKYYENEDYRKEINNENKLLSLELSGQKNLVDVSMLGGIHKLILNNCENIVDVSNLGSLYELSLVNCENVIDVSNLGSLHTLNLSGCKNIIDVSNLGSVHILNLSRCESIKDVSNLGSVQTLNLSHCNIKDVSNLCSVHTLDLICCKNIKDVSMLGEAHTLNLSYCENIKDVSMLGWVHTLNLNKCKNIKDIGYLKKTKKLSINTKVYGLHLLKELEELKVPREYDEDSEDEYYGTPKKISKKWYKQMKGEIKKLQRKNKKVKIIPR